MTAPRDTTDAGPSVLDCPQQCEIPDGVTARLVPYPRHAWGDVKVCPNDGCGLAVLILEHES